MIATQKNTANLFTHPLFLIIALVYSMQGLQTQAHNGSQPSIHDTVQGIKQRLRETIEPSRLLRLNEVELLKILTPEEKSALSTGFIRFTANQDVEVTLFADKEKESPFWLSSTGFKKGNPVKVDSTRGEQEHRLWSKTFQAGEISLGVNGLQGSRGNYMIAVKPLANDSALEITDLYPGQLRVSEWKQEAEPYADLDAKLKAVPLEVQGQTMIRNLYYRSNTAEIAGVFNETKYPSQPHPDQITLTWSQDPKSTQTIQWRTDTTIDSCKIYYIPSARKNSLKPGKTLEASAQMEVLTDENLVNDPVSHRFTTTLSNLNPDTKYSYCIGYGEPESVTEWMDFTTAPEGVVPFSFIYMGDAQNGLHRWGTLVKNAFRERPDAAFYVMAGDLVNRGNDRDDWDSFFYNAKGVYEYRTLVPAIGNHENQGGHPTLYLKNFTLFENGSLEIEKERSYYFEYGNALFVILDTNLEVEPQKAWLEEVLANTKATWKFAVFHHPAYSSAPNRDNRSIREHWLPIFDKYHVDMALQGHDHGYLRTFPMKGNERVKSASEGTYYVVSVSGTKMYDQAPRPETEVGFTQVSTYQVLDIQIQGDKLLYRAYDTDGRLRDEVEIIKNDWRTWE